MEYKESKKGLDFIQSISDKRIIITHIVAAATQRLIAKAEIVKKAFLNTGISIQPDGLKDTFIRIKDIPAEEIDFTGQEVAEEIIVRLEDKIDPFLNDKELIAIDDDNLLTITRYHQQHVKDLQIKLKTRGLKVSGKKAELVRRLQEYDLQRSRVLEVRETIYCGQDDQHPQEIQCHYYLAKRMYFPPAIPS